MSDERCGNCKFYDKQNEITHSQLDDGPLHEHDFEAVCRRYPPVRGDADFYGSLSQSDVQRDCFSGPIVNCHTGWCGEWKPAPEGEAA